MAWPVIVTSALSGIGSIFKGLMGFKESQAQVVSQALKTLGDLNVSDAEAHKAIAQIIAAEATSESWLTRMWRPILMAVCMGILISSWFGYVPPNFNEPLTPMMDEIFGLIKIGLGGYIGSRGVEKIIKTLKIGDILKTFIEKKIS